MRSPRHRQGLTTGLLGLGLLVGGACKPEPRPARPPLASPITSDLNRYTTSPIGAPVEGKPWITHVTAVDLDRDGLIDVIACDSQKNEVGWLRQSSRGHFDETPLAGNLPAPVHVSAVDIDGDGDLDLLVAGMGQVFPSNDKIGAVIILENRGHEQFLRHDVMTGTHRVTDVQAGDLDGDGRLDLVVAKFGYDQGEVTWMRNRGNWTFDSTPLINLPGAVNVAVADLTGDHAPDIVALISQQYEEIHLLENDAHGTFQARVIFGSTNEDFGSSGISLCDLNRDGRTDILYTNGDGFDYAEPGARPWHGVQWLENKGSGYFRFHRIGSLPGAYSPVGVDLDRDGQMDVVCVSGFNNWSDPGAAALVAFMNEGNTRFRPVVLAHEPTHLISVTAADLDGNGVPVLVTGGFHAYPPWDRMSRVRLWRRN